MTNHFKKPPLIIDLKQPSSAQTEPVAVMPQEKKLPQPMALARVASSRKVYGAAAVLSASLVSLVVGAVSGYSASWFSYQKSDSVTFAASSTAPVIEKKSTESIVARVGKLILLPIDEEATIATVSDLQKLRDQLFFKNAKNGDVVLMYAKAKRAILFNPDLNKIIEVAPITVNAK